MRTGLIACRTIDEEIRQILSGERLSYDRIDYVDSGLHNSREQLKRELKQRLADMEQAGVERIIMSFGLCGNAIDGIKTGDYELVMPRCQDCITLMLGSPGRRACLDEEAKSYYLTEGWLHGEADLHKQYVDACNMYGKSTADDIFAEILDGYERVTILDTGRNDYENFCAKGELIAADFHLKTRREKAELSWLIRLLKQDFETLKKENLIVIYPPHSTMTWRDFIS